MEKQRVRKGHKPSSPGRLVSLTLGEMEGSFWPVAGKGGLPTWPRMKSVRVSTRRVGGLRWLVWAFVKVVCGSLRGLVSLGREKRDKYKLIFSHSNPGPPQSLCIHRRCSHPRHPNCRTLPQRFVVVYPFHIGRPIRKSPLVRGTPPFLRSLVSFVPKTLASSAEAVYL